MRRVTFAGNAEKAYLFMESAGQVVTVLIKTY